VRYGPRTLDLDVLWMEGVVCATASLEIPHPRLEERAFALWPLVDVAPFATNPHGVPYERGDATGILEVGAAL
jgi:2-amino-4-hydroxy-6-hydroxymethyldihydropteridine diphosphokinase